MMAGPTRLARNVAYLRDQQCAGSKDCNDTVYTIFDYLARPMVPTCAQPKLLRSGFSFDPPGSRICDTSLPEDAPETAAAGGAAGGETGADTTMEVDGLDDTTGMLGAGGDAADAGSTAAHTTTCAEDAAAEATLDATTVTGATRPHDHSLCMKPEVLAAEVNKYMEARPSLAAFITVKEIAIACDTTMQAVQALLRHPERHHHIDLALVLEYASSRGEQMRTCR